MTSQTKTADARVGNNIDDLSSLFFAAAICSQFCCAFALSLTAPAALSGLASAEE